jgi:hypothetical protein
MRLLQPGKEGSSRNRNDFVFLHYGYACGLGDKIVGENDQQQDYRGIFTKYTADERAAPIAKGIA